MKRKALALTLMLALSISALAGTYLVHFGSANFIAEPLPPGIRINSDGLVEGTSALECSGNVYTFTGDIYDTIVVLRDDIVIDGAGYTLQGNGNSTGVFLQDRSNVIIKNVNIKNFDCGIKFTMGYDPPENPISHRVIGNNITDNICGIFLSGPVNAVILENSIADNTYGVSIWSTSNVFRNNTFHGNTYSFLDNTGGFNDVDTSNVIEGKPVYYWVNQHDRTVPSNAGLVVLKNCSGITVQNLELKGNGHGVLLYYTTDSMVTENVLTGNLEGVTLKESFNNIISGNRIINNNGAGIYLYHSTNNTISNNEVTANANDGVNLDYSINNTVAENKITSNNGNGVFFKNIQDSKVIGNNITFNKGCGIGFGYGPNGVVKGNYITKNGLGIWISNAFDNTITLNTVSDNEGWGIELEGSQKNNIIHHNNFINNSRTEELQAHIKGVWTYPGLNKPHPPGEEPEPPKLVAGAANVWDDGGEGNYWSDYASRYPNASEVGNTGVGDTPYFINENNMDRHPLMAPLDIDSVTVEPPEWANTTPSPSTPPSQEPPSTPEPKAESFPTAPVAAASGASVALIGIGLLVYFRKRNGGRNR
jgi:parallel beta-helix repeat protein